MSRINTNVSSLIAQHSLMRSNADLEQSLQRLSTGLRINSGRDDPAGLIASENLRRDIASTNKAISNSERASQLIATADSALGQVSKLLTDIRGLITEAASSGNMSTEQIAANQLQVDSSLEAIDRVARVTTFQGRKILDGSLDFTVSGSTNFDRLSNLRIDQANLGTAGSMAVTVTVTTAATQAQVNLTGIPAATAATNAYADTTVSNAIAQASGTVTLTNGSFTLSADAGGAADGAEGNGVDVAIVDNGGGAATAAYNGTDTITVSVDIGGGATVNDIYTAINNDLAGDFTATNLVGGAGAAVVETIADPMTGGRDAGSATIRVTADTAGTAANGVTVTLLEDAVTNPNPNTATAALNGGNIEVYINGTVTYSDIAAAIDGLTGYSASITTSTGDQNYIDTSDSPPAAATLANGVDGSGGLTQDVVFELAGKDGSEIFSFSAGTTINQLEAAIDALSDSTGVTATINSTTLELTSTAYGSAAYVDIKVLEEAAGGTLQAAVGAGTRSTGTDVVARINGLEATGRGNVVSLNSSVLDLSLEVDTSFTGDISFTITGGGALFQLGPSVESSQQARIGISSMSTASLGGASGRLYQLRSGENAALDTDTTTAANIVDEVITKVVELRGRLGAFQRTTLDTNIASLQDTLTNLTEAESSIRDADFAEESAALTRAQILVQSGTSVLAIANQNPQNVLALLR